MIGADRRKAIFLLHREGMGAREIARRLHVARNTVRAIIAQEGQAPAPAREVQVKLDPELLRRLYEECGGWVQRVHEKLEESGTRIAYATLTRRLRELGISVAPSQRCAEVPDRPGVEMQHDTSPYTVDIRCCSPELTHLCSRELSHPGSVFLLTRIDPPWAAAGARQN